MGKYLIVNYSNGASEKYITENEEDIWNELSKITSVDVYEDGRIINHLTERE